MPNQGVIIGLNNVVYALLVTDPAPGGGNATYGAVKSLAGAIEATVNPNSSNATLFADNGPYDTATALGEPQLTLNVADIPIEVQAELFGHAIVGGRLSRKAGDVPPWVAVGYKSLKSNGKYRYTWLNKGKFGLPEQMNKTKGDSVEFQTPTVTANFVKRDCDDEWQTQIDEDHINYIASMGTNWFNDPYGGAADSTAPTISSVVPAANATGVAISTTVVWTFNEALALDTLTTDHFVVVKDSDGVPVTGSLSVNAARTIVTFTPSANLAATTAYRAIVTTGVKNLAGLKLAATSVTKFTTA